jgi:hypothetical protein
LLRIINITAYTTNIFFHLFISLFNEPFQLSGSLYYMDAII